MHSFFDTELAPLPLFGPIHLLSVVVLALIGVWLVRAGMAASERGRQRLRIGIIVAIIFFRLTRHAWLVFVGLWSVQTDLGLHLCSIMSWITVYGLWRRRTWTLRAMYFFGIAGAVQAVLTPDAVHGVVHYTFVETMASHGLLVMAGIWAVKVEGYRPRTRDPWIALGLLNLYAALMYPLNRLLGSNYLYVIAKPETASILDVFPGWPWYILLLEPVAIGLFLALYLPFRQPADTSRTPAAAPGAAGPHPSPDCASRPAGRR